LIARWNRPRAVPWLVIGDAAGAVVGVGALGSSGDDFWQGELLVRRRLVALGHPDFGKLPKDRAEHAPNENPESGCGKKPQPESNGMYMRVEQAREGKKRQRNRHRTGSGKQHPQACRFFVALGEDDGEDAADQRDESPEESYCQWDEEDASRPSVEQTQHARQCEAAEAGSDCNDGRTQATVHVRIVSADSPGCNPLSRADVRPALAPLAETVSFFRESRKPPDRRPIELRAAGTCIAGDQGECLDQAELARFFDGHLRGEEVPGG
jgi:hypothetical protein